MLLSLLLASVPAARATGTGGSEASQEERNKAVARRVFEEIFNEGRFEVADTIYAPDFVNHGLKRNANLQEDQEAVHQEKAAFPDLRMSIDLMVAERDLVTVIWTFRGTHARAGYGWLPPTGAKISMRGITVWRIVDGRIRDEWTSFNQLGAYMQLLNHVKWLVTALVLAALVLAWGAVRGLRHLWARRRRGEA